MSEFKFCCPLCGQPLTGDDSCAGQAIPCPSCGQTITLPAPPAPALSEAPTTAPAGTCGLAVASLTCSSAGLLCGFFGTIPGIICGLKALKRIRQTPRLGGKGLAIAGLITGGVLSVLWIPLAFILTMGIIGGFRNAARVQQANAMKEKWVEYGGANLDTTPDGSGWTLDLEEAPLPDAPLTGRIHGIPFKPDQISMGGILSFVAPESDLDLYIDFDTSDTAKFAGQTLVVRKDDTGNILSKEGNGFKKPSIRYVWLDPATKQFRNGLPKIYALRLEFGEIKNGYMPGRIYLCMLDDTKSFIRGKFVAEVSQSASKSPVDKTQQLGATAAPDTNPDAAGWTLDVANAVIPDAPVSGRMYGRPFKPQAVELQSVFLTFRQGNFPNQQEFVISLSPANPDHPTARVDLNDPTRFNGQAFTATSSDGRFQRARLSVNSTLPGDYAPEIGWPDNYAIRLEFGEYKDGKLPGRICLCALAGRKSFLRGKFEARVIRFAAGAAPGSPTPPRFTPPAPPSVPAPAPPPGPRR